MLFRSFDNKEIEIKIALDITEYERLNKILSEKAQLIKHSVELDEYFSPTDKAYFKEKYPFEWLSIRKRNSKLTLNYKHFYPEGAEKHTYCDEFETEISSDEMLKNILNSLNVESVVTVKKKRIVFIYQNKWEVVLDKVEELGCFIEIEALEDQGGIEATRNCLFELVKYFEIDINKIDYRGYPDRKSVG